ncbi:MAG: rhodanese-like domain-containing protein [Dinoroseobacter sp.]|nr:rhodanese-like domain-containing protein [Dinoroseobacter sp.]MDJ0992738.1 rhodanese-like domain-containing protein [Dinoroseobacter sp.]
MKTANDYLEEANAVVPKISAETGIQKHKAGNSVFVDVRDSADVAKSGTIAGAVLATRGMLEFKADETHPLHDPNLKKDADIVLVCGAGGQAALSGKTLLDMGFQSVSNVGGISAWKDAGGPMEQS